MEEAAATVGGLFLFSRMATRLPLKKPRRAGVRRQGELNPPITSSFWRFAP